MWSDPIADMLTRIRNAARVRRKEVSIPASKVKKGIAKILKDEGYIHGYDIIDNGLAGLIRIDLKYGSRGEDVIHKIDRVSKPGCRVYSGVADLPRVLDGLGIAIVSTSKGVMSDQRCREENVSGEILCKVY